MVQSINPNSAAENAAAAAAASQAGQTTETKASEEAQSTPQPNVAETAEKTANQTQTNGFFTDALNSASGFVASAANSTSTFFADVQGTVVDYTAKGTEALSYNSLKVSGEALLSEAGRLVTDTYETVSTSSPVETAQAWISSGAEAIGSAADSSAKLTHSNWLPVSVVAVAAFTAVKSTQAAVQNFSAGSLKKSVAQIIVGASAAALAGSVVYQTGVLQSASNQAQEYLNSFNKAAD